MTTSLPKQAVTALGNGYNVFTGSARPTCLGPIKAKDAGDHQQTANAYVCTTAEDVYNFLGVDASIAISIPWGSFAAKMAFVKSLDISTTTLIILVRASRVTSSEAVFDPPSFLSVPKDGASLFKNAGSGYVSSISYGGEFLAAWTFTTYDETSFTSLQAEAQLEFGVGAWDFNANFSAKIENLKKYRKSVSSLVQRAIGFDKTSLPTTDQFVNFVLNFANLELDGPAVVEFSVESYSSIENCPADFEVVDTYRTAYEPEIPEQKGYAENLALAKSRLSLVNKVADLYSRYRSSDPQLYVVKANLEQDISDIENWLDAVIEKPTDPDIATPLLIGIYAGYPVARYTLLQDSLPMGGNGGNPFMDITLEDIGLGYKLSSFAFSGDSWVTGINSTYTSDIDSLPISKNNGGGSGSSSPTHQMGEDEYVEKISIDSGTYVNQITVTTNKQSFRPWPPNPDSCENSRTYITPDNQMFVGWMGRSGGFLDQLTPLYVSFSPAKWLGGTDSTAQSLAIPQKSLSARFESGQLNSPDADGILSTIKEWASNKWPTIQQIFLQKGGWEGWAQVELAMLLQQKFPAATIVRENLVYEASIKRCDISLDLKGEVFQIIELKCESLWQDSGGNNAFCNAFKVDIKKIYEYPIRPTGKPARLWVFGFTCTDEIAQQVANYTWGSIRLGYSKLGTSPIGTLYIWYCFRDVTNHNSVSTVSMPREEISHAFPLELSIFRDGSRSRRVFERLIGEVRPAEVAPFDPHQAE